MININRPDTKQFRMKYWILNNLFNDLFLALKKKKRIIYSIKYDTFNFNNFAWSIDQIFPNVFFRYYNVSVDPFYNLPNVYNL